jgi:hypothetical protein
MRTDSGLLAFACISLLCCSIISLIVELDPVFRMVWKKGNLHKLAFDAAPKPNVVDRGMELSMIG